MRKIEILRVIVVFGFALLLSSFVKAETKNGTPTKKQTAAAKKEQDEKLSDAEKKKLKEAQAILGQLNTYKKSQLTRILNSGKKAELIALPNVGEATADAIIAARPLESSAHLVLVKGIGIKTFTEIIKARK